MPKSPQPRRPRESARTGAGRSARGGVKRRTPNTPQADVQAPEYPLDAATNPDDFVGYTIVRVGHVLERQFDAVLAAHGLTPRQFGVLAQLARDPGLGSGELARLVLITAQSMGALLDDLASAGLLTRTPSSRGRRRHTSLTAKGFARLAAAAPAVAEFERATTAAIPLKDRRAVNAALHTMLRALTAPE